MNFEEEKIPVDQQETENIAEDLNRRTATEMSSHPRRSFLQWLRDLFSDNEISSDDEEEELLKSAGSPISNFIYRYIYKKQCPYCFHYVSGKVYIEKHAPKQRTSISRIPFSMPRIKTCVCPTCRKELPSDFFDNRSSSIAIVGGHDSGKSSFITVLCELLIHRRTTLSELGIFGSIINEEGKDLFEDNRRVLIDQRKALNPTLNKAPIILRIHSIHHNKVTYLTLIDTPGENFSRIDELTKHHANLRFAQGIIFLMNPLDIRELFHLIQEAQRGIVPVQPDIKTSNYDIVENLYELFRRGDRIKSNRKIQVPTAFCLSRADLLEGVANVTLSPDFEADLSDTRDIMDEAKSASEDLMELLEETDINLLHIMKARFNRYNVFPVSPLGKQPVESALGSEIHGGIDPKGILMPIIWMLKEINFIKVS